jgi:hypothetical protein
MSNAYCLPAKAGGSPLPLGLIYLYEIDLSPIWLNTAARALSYLAKTRIGLAEVLPAHWH